jgi:GH35 family endo-1,4-beta-xylanase
VLFSRRDFSKLASALCLNTSAPFISTAAENIPESLAVAYKNKFLLGAAITPGQITAPTSAFIKHHFNIIVAENAMKPEELARNGEGSYNFSYADAMVDFAINNNIKVRGHTLLWHQQMPGWFFVENGQRVSRSKLISRLETYIHDVVTHFKGRVFAWDVVNEAFVFGDAQTPTDSNGMRMNIFRQVIGPEYIEIAFSAAAKADPNALLFYNDYETQDTRKIAAISKMVKNFKARGVKIDGIGHQAHCSFTHPSISAFENAIDEYAKLGITQHVTELDIVLNQTIMESKVTEATPELLQRQAQRYADLFKLFTKKRKHITAVLVWGISDAHTWLTYWPEKRFEAPLLFDKKLQPKPAYKALLNVAKSSIL